MNESITQIAQAFPELEGYILDETVDDIYINPDGGVFITRAGTLDGELIGNNLFSQEQLFQILHVLSQSFTGGEMNAAYPFLNIDFQDGSQLDAIIPPASPDGVMITMTRKPPPGCASAEAIREKHLREQETRRQKTERQIEQEWTQLQTQGKLAESENAREARDHIRKSLEQFLADAIHHNNTRLAQNFEKQLKNIRERERQRTHSKERER